MDYYGNNEDFDGEFSPEMYYDDPDYSDVSEMLHSGWFGPDHVERLSLRDIFDRCIIPTISQAAFMVFPLVTLSLLFKIICALATEVDRPHLKKLKKLNLTAAATANEPNPTSSNGNGTTIHRKSSENKNKNEKKGTVNGKGRESQNKVKSEPNTGRDTPPRRDKYDLLAVSVVHSTSAIFGMMALHLFFRWNAIYLGVMSAVLYLALILSHKLTNKQSGPILSVCVAMFIAVCELIVLEKSAWTQVRGAAMILAMKVISIGFDLDVGVIPFPEIHEFVGYTFNIGTVIFGPWVSFQDYMCVELQHKYKMGLRWFAKIVTSLLCSGVCLFISTCVVHWLILDGAYKWITAYRDAQSFRFSHYFISYLSEVTAVCAGLGAVGFNEDTEFHLTVVRSYNIEFPRSLVEVVTNWNLPMHYWLKTYVFRAARPLGTFVAILLTYAASSLLHGLNFQLAAVLFSLGFYSYVEYVLRKKLAKIFNACIEAKKCREECNHTYRWSHPVVIFVNLSFALLSMFHLAYLGLMFDSSGDAETGYTMEHTLNKWAKLDYLSHWIAVGSFVFYFLI